MSKNQDQRFVEIKKQLTKAAEGISHLADILESGTKREALNGVADVVAHMMEMVWLIARMDPPSEWAFTKVMDGFKFRYTMHLSDAEGHIEPEEFSEDEDDFGYDDSW